MGSELWLSVAAQRQVRERGSQTWAVSSSKGSHRAAGRNMEELGALEKEHKVPGKLYPRSSCIRKIEAERKGEGKGEGEGKDRFFLTQEGLTMARRPPA